MTLALSVEPRPSSGHRSSAPNNHAPFFEVNLGHEAFVPVRSEAHWPVLTVP